MWSAKMQKYHNSPQIFERVVKDLADLAFYLCRCSFSKMKLRVYDVLKKLLVTHLCLNWIFQESHEAQAT